MSNSHTGAENAHSWITLTREATLYEAEKEKHDLLVFMRMFGKDVMVNKLNEHPASLMKKLGKPRESLFKSMQFIDSEVTVPTCAGLPLNLTVTTTGGLDYEAKTEFDNGNFIFKFKLHAELQGRVRMSTNAHLINSGLQMRTTVRTSSDIQAVKEGEKMTIKLPKNAELFTLESEFDTILDGKTEPQQLITDDIRQINVCSGETMKSVTGLRLCQKIRYVNATNQKNAPHFPFTGPMKANLYMKSEDVPNGYELEVYFGRQDFRFSIDTPGSKTSRKTAVEKKGDKFSLSTPFRKTKVEGTLTNSPSKKVLEGHVSSDNKMHKLLAQLEMKYTKSFLLFAPKIELISKSNGVDTRASAHLEIVPRKRFDFNSSYIGHMGPVFVKVSGQNLKKAMGVVSVIKTDKTDYSAILRINNTPKKSGGKYDSSLTLKEKDIVKFDAKSELNHDGKSKVAMTFKIDKAFSKPILASFIAALNTGKNKNKQLLKTNLKSEWINYKLNMDVERRSAGIYMRGLASYLSSIKNFRGNDQLLFTLKSRTSGYKKTKIRNAIIGLSSKNHKERNFNVKGKLTQTTGHSDVSFDVVYGEPSKKAINTVKVNLAFSHSIKPIAREVTFHGSVKRPKKVNLQINGTAFYTHIWPLRKVDVALSMWGFDNKQTENKVRVFFSNGRVKGSRNIEANVSLDTPQKDMGIDVKIEHLVSNIYKHNVFVKWQKGKSAGVDSLMKITSQDFQLENTVNFPNNKNAKLMVNVNKNNNNYKGFSMIHADQGIISKQSIDLKAKSNVKYIKSGGNTHGEVNLELESDASNKLKFTASHHDTNGQKTTTKIDMTTPFEALKSYSDSIEQTVDNKELSYSRKIQWRSYGNENDIKADVNYNKAIQKLNGTYSSSINTYKTDVELGFKNSANKKSALFKVKHNKPTPLVFIKMDHARDRRQVTTDASLMFDMSNSNGKVKFAMQKDDREIAFSGDANVKISNKKLEGTYSLKHNIAESSVKLDFRNNKNQGAISAVVTKNKPGNMKADVSVTLNNKPQLKLVGNSVWSKKNIDLSAEVTDHKDRKTTGSFNLNLSGTRKTANAEIKSDSTDITLSGALNIQNNANIDSELQIGVNGKNLLLSGDYKKESANHRINANIGLPDGKQIQMQTSFSNAAKKSLSFNVKSEDFIDVDFSTQLDNVNFMVDASVEVLPYLEKTHLKATLAKDKTWEASAELETPYDPIKQAKVTVSLVIDGKKQDMISVKTFLNSKKFSSFKLLTNIKGLNNFSVKTIVTTPHSKFNEFLFDIAHSTDLRNFDSKVEMKAGKIFMIKSTLKNEQHNTDIDFNMNMGGKTLGGKFVRNKSDMTFDMSYKRGQDMYTTHLMTNGKQGNLELTAPGDRKFNANMDFSPSDVKLNLETSLQLDTNNYKFVVAYEHKAKFHLLFSIPSYTSEVMMTFSGTLESFDSQADFTFNNDKYTFTMANKDKMFAATVTTPLIKSKMDLTKNGGWDMMTMNFEAKYKNIDKPIILSLEKDHKKINFDLSAPAFEIQFQMDNKINSVVVNLSLKSIKFELVYSDKDAKPKSLSLNLSIPKHNFVTKINFDEKKSGMDGNIVTTYNGKKLNLNGSYKTMDQKKIFNGKIETPTNTYDITGTLSGKMKKFKITAKLQHNKNVYEITMSNKAFKTLNLNLLAPGFKLKMDFEGELQKFKYFTSMNFGEKQLKGSISNQNYWNGINVDITVKLSNYEMKYEFDSDMGKMHLSTQLLWNQDQYSFSSTVNTDTHTYALSVLSPWFTLKTNIMNGFQSSNMETKVMLSHGTYDLAVSQNGQSLNITATGLGKQRLNIQLSKTSVILRFQNEDDIHEYHLTWTKDGFSVNYSFPVNKGEVKAKFNSYKDFTVNAQLLNKRNTYKLEATNNKNKEIKFHTTIPYGKELLLLFENTGNSRNGKIRATIKYGEYYGEYNARWQSDDSNVSLQMGLNLDSKTTKATISFKRAFEPNMEILFHSLEVTINNRKSSIKSTVNMSNGWNGSIVLNDPYTGRAVLRFKVKPTDMRNIKSNVMLDHYLTGNVSVNYEHTLTKTSFMSKGDLEMENVKFGKYEMEVNFQDKDYNIKADIKNGKYNINCKGSFKDGRKSISIQVKTPFRYFRDVTYGAEFHSKGMLKFSITLPRQFYAAKMDWKNGGLTTDIDLHMDRKDVSKQFKVVVSYMNADDRATVSRATNVKLIHGNTVLTTDINLKKSRDMYMIKGEFSWGEEDDQKIGAELHIKTAEKKEMSLTLMSHHRNSVITCSRESGRDRHNIMCALTPDASKKNNKIEIDADIFNYDNKKIFDINIKLPNQKNSMKLKIVTNGPNENTIFSIRTQLSIGEDATNIMVMETKLSNNNGNYTLNWMFEHPYSNLHLEIMAFANAQRYKYNTGVELSYLTSNRKMENLMLRGDIDKHRGEMNIEMKLPKKHLQISGSVASGDQFAVTFNKKENGMKDMHASATINRDTKYMLFEMNYDRNDPNKVFRMKGQVMKNRAIMKAFTNAGQKVNKEGRINIELRPSSILLTQIFWNPDIANELNDYCYAVLQHYGNEIKSLGDGLGEFLSEEIPEKVKLMKKAFSEPLDIMTSFMSAEYDHFSKDIAKHAKQIGEFYERNTFYVKSAVELWDSMWVSYQRDIENLWRYFQHFNRRMQNMMEEAAMHIEYYYMQAQREYQIKEMEMSRALDEILHYIREQYNNGYRHLQVLHREIQIHINRFPVMMKRARRQMREHPIGKTVLENGERIFNAVYQHVSTHPWADSVRDIGSKVYHQAKWAFDYWQVEENLYSLKDNVVKYIRKELNTLADIFDNLNLKTLIFDPKNGEIVVEFHYKSLLSAYKYARSINQVLKSITHVVKKCVDMLPTSWWSISDVYYTLKPYTSLRNWLPPYEARASMFASHIRTFDGRHFDFKGICSYILAYSESNFEVIANYSPKKNQPTLLSVNIKIGENDNLRFLKDYRVIHNGRVAELPFNTRDAKIFRTNNIVTLLGNSGYTIEINPSSGFYAVSVSGWYFNRVSGLFGTNNNEQYDDMRTNTGQLASDLEDFTLSWITTLKCRSENQAERHNVPNSHMCSVFYKDTSSPFRNCFKQVNPEHFYAVCNSYSYAMGEGRKVVCDLADYYSNACIFRGVYLNKLPSCRWIGKKK
ncbi:uncharacterized protein LOC118768488 [Octopus sinensis]|uniref:Uncharacterized protein LOC118768488 n=1 Tax=Octopus sinensis TaxID=2607531 RepID=A0A7E6FTT3_9MOLL|nr:uncharacterized protein LOC118768488 [Octopus sinensis]